MSKESVSRILELNRKLLFFVVDAAELAMPRDRFRPFKKVIFDHFHKVIKPALHQELGVGAADSEQEPQSKIRAVPNDDREGGVP